MEETLFIKVFFGIFLSLWTIGTFFIAFKFFYRYLQEEKYCTSETVGTVRSYEWISRGKGVHLPIVSFVVNGEEYKTVGPRYKWFKTVKIKKTLHINTKQEYKMDPYEQTFKQKITGSGMVLKNPMQELFPIGSTLPIFYDPNNPKLSYVLRYCDQKWIFWLLLSVGILALLLNILLQLFL